MGVFFKHFAEGIYIFVTDVIDDLVNGLAAGFELSITCTLGKSSVRSFFAAQWMAQRRSSSSPVDARKKEPTQRLTIVLSQSTCKIGGFAMRRAGPIGLALRSNN